MNFRERDTIFRSFEKENCFQGCRCYCIQLCDKLLETFPKNVVFSPSLLNFCVKIERDGGSTFFSFN